MELADRFDRRYASGFCGSLHMPPPTASARRHGGERGAAFMKPDDFFSLAKKNQANMVDLKFVDMLGTWQHCSFPIDLWDAGTFKEGLGFDGSSIRGWMGIHESDMLAIPDAGTGCIDPFFAKPTLSVIANIVDPVTGKDFTRDPRHVARKATAYLKDSGIADICYI